jgi:carbon-monoxide dehydrogenase large subunit
MQLGRPVKWTEDRSENYKVTIHGRDHVEHVEMCDTRDGKITGIRTKVYAGLGAYASTAGPGIPTILHGLVYSGPYTIPNIHGTIHGVYTTTTPVDAYRGAGRPEAAYLIERLVDIYARKIGMDPVEVRRKNFIPADKFPYAVPTGLTYDSGNYAPALEKALKILDYPAFRNQQGEARKQGRYLGVGVVSYIEICGSGPSQVAGAIGFGGGQYDSAIVRVYPTGMIRVYDTGNTLRANGLVERETILHCGAVLVANRAAQKLKLEAYLDLMNRLERDEGRRAKGEGGAP